jgi:protein SCO1/2
MNKKLIFTLSAALLLSACDSPPAQPPLSEAPLAGATIGGDFTLTDQNGKKRTFKEFDGAYRIVYF